MAGFEPDPSGWFCPILDRSSYQNVLAARDFFSIEPLVKGKLTRCMVLSAIDLSARNVEILGVRSQPNGPWMEQIACHATGGERFLPARGT